MNKVKSGLLWCLKNIKKVLMFIAKLKIVLTISKDLVIKLYDLLTFKKKV